MPDYSPLNGWMPGEVEMALQALSADSPQDCTLLEAQCIIPELQESAEQYEDLEQLIRDGNDLGYVLDEQGQGQPDFLEKYFAAMELERCDTISMALDIALNLNCYDMVLAGQEKEYGLIENYFELRESSLNNPEAISRSNKVMNSSVELSESVIDDEINRQQQIISKMQERDNIYVVNATTTPRITETSIM